MGARSVAILGTGLVASVGFTAPACCGAFRARISNPLETGFIDSGGAWIMAHQVDLDPPCAGLAKLAGMACLAIEEALHDLDRDRWSQLPRTCSRGTRSREVCRTVVMLQRHLN